MFINPFNSFEMGFYGAGYGFGTFAPIMPFDVFSPGFSLYGNIWKAGCSVGNIVGSWPPGFSCGQYGAVSTYMDWLYGRLQARKGPSKENRREPLPLGTDSPSYAERGRSYVREKLGLGKKLPEYNKVARNLYGPTPKDEESKARYKGFVDEDRKNDSTLRAITENIVSDWIKDEKAEGQFLRKWNIAMRDGDHVMAVRALLDPYGDGKYLREISNIVTGISDKDDLDTMWKKIADHLNNTIGFEAIFAMGDETSDICMTVGGIAGSEETPITNRESYISKVVDKGYLREEAEKIVEPLASEEEADELIRNLNDQRSTANNLKELKEKLKTGKAEEKKQAEQNIAILEKQRAEQYLQDFMRFARWRYGQKKADSFGYKAGELPKDVSDVPTAVKWAYGNLGIKVEVPERSAGQQVGKSAGHGGKGGGGKAITKLDYSEDDQYVLRAKGYTDKDMQMLQSFGMKEVDKIPDKKDFALFAARSRKFNNLNEVARFLGQFGGSGDGGLSESDYLTGLNDPNASVSEIADLIKQAADYRNKSSPPANP